MNIVFLNPPFFGAFNREVRFQSVSPQKALHPPILLGYAAAIAKKDNHQVDLIDAPAEELNSEQTIERIAGQAPDIIVMLTSTGSVNSDAVLGRKLREVTNALIVAVGVHASSVPEDTLRRGFDAVARGEYEYTIRDLLNGVKLENCQGISYKNRDGSIANNTQRPLIENLDEMPYPAREFLPNNKYHSALYKNPFTFMLAGRGCPNLCTFCAIPQVMNGRRYRVRSPENVVAEMEHIRDVYKLKSILFNDDTLNAIKPHLLELTDMIVKRKVNIPWAAYSRVDTVDEEIADAMADAGCYLVKVGFESGVDEILQKMKKGRNATTGRARQAVKQFHDAGIQIHGTFVFGMPGETKETIQKTIDFAKSCDIDFVQFSVAQPYPGTEFYDYVKENGFLKNEGWDDYLNMEGCIQPIFEYPGLSREQMTSALRDAYRQYYLRPSYFRKALKQRLTNPELMKSSWKSAFTLLNYIRN